jgi:epoxyqueuosine reductase
LLDIDLVAELDLSQEEFSARFKGSPVKRTKRRGYLRNVAVVLGNLGNPAALPALAAALEDPDPLIRAHAAWALGEIGGEGAITLLNNRAKTEVDSQVLLEIQGAVKTVVEDSN